MARRRLPGPVIAAAAFVLVFCAVFNYFVFDHSPHVHDEIVYLFQARIFLTGHFSAPLPCAPESFDFPHMVNVGRWYSIYPPGFPALLAVGLVAGVPWLINPLLGALAVILFFFLGAEVYDRRTGILASLLGAASIWMLLMSSSMMAHTASMAAAALFLLFVFRSFRSPTIGSGLAAGAGLGLALLIRPYNAAILAAPFLLSLAVRTLKEFKRRWKNLLALALVAGLALGFYLYYNAATTGEALKPGYLARYGSAYSVIFGRPATLDYDYTPLIASLQIFENLKAINNYLFGWPLTSLWPLLFVLWAMVLRREERGRTFLLFSAFLVMLVGFFFFWGAFIAFGARMFFDALPILVVLSAKGLVEAPALMAGKFRKIGLPAWRKIGAAVLVLFTVYALAVRFPAWTAPPWSEWFYERYDHNLAGSSAWVHNAVRAGGVHDAVIVIKFLYAPLAGFPTGWWGSGFMHDTPGLDGDVIYANDLGPEANLKLARCYPRRTLYYYWGTLDKAMLVPLEMDGEGFRPGGPVVVPASGKRQVELVGRPEDVFMVYSAEFGGFLRETFEAEGWTAVDGNRLRDIGLGLVAAGEFRKASWAFEASLQVEKDPTQRWRLLSHLTKCYTKTRQTAEAKRIMRSFEEADFKIPKIFNILPSRGF